MIARARVHCFDDEQGRPCFGKTRLGCTVAIEIVENRGELERPRLIPAWILPRGRLRRPHLRQHPVMYEPLQSITAAQPIDRQLAVAAVDLERKQVLPLAAA